MTPYSIFFLEMKMVELDVFYRKFSGEGGAELFFRAPELFQTRQNIRRPFFPALKDEPPARRWLPFFSPAPDQTNQQENKN
ncbi:hypothetical protein C2845_PM04G16320 [Panicum miliaceum]|uniref:Uncharacterized protein n=1 Tax=Panicum miliaceum TaxID=4540 RepID=A0A3L6QWJ3_PANMI|nr:hypothetical protein C2845_PM04G16320 [Panicum miliaceum]